MPSGHIDAATPLRPLTDYAWRVLERLARAPMQAHLINPGVYIRLRREGLVGQKTGAKPHIFITDDGRIKLLKGVR